MIGGLQGEFEDLDNKYLKQNIPKDLKMSVRNIRKLQENTAALYTERKIMHAFVIRRSRYVYPDKLKRPPLPSGCEISGCKMSVHGIPDMKCQRTYPDVKCLRRQALRIDSIRIPLRGHARHTIQGNFIRIPSEGHVACSPIRLVSITPGRQHILSRCVVRIIDLM